MNIQRRGRELLVALIASQACACATQYSGATQRITISPEPSDSLVMIDDVQTHRGAQTIDLVRSRIHIVRVEKAGFEPDAVTLEQRMNGLFWLNFLWGPAFPIGMAVDAGSGAMWKLEPSDVRVNLKPAPRQ